MTFYGGTVAPEPRDAKSDACSHMARTGTGSVYDGKDFSRAFPKFDTHQEARRGQRGRRQGAEQQPDRKLASFDAIMCGGMGSMVNNPPDAVRANVTPSRIRGDTPLMDEVILTARRDIERGDEIFLSYCNAEFPKEMTRFSGAHDMSMVVCGCRRACPVYSDVSTRLCMSEWESWFSFFFEKSPHRKRPESGGHMGGHMGGSNRLQSALR